MYDKTFWNERYAGSEYLYGTEANAFLVENVDLLQGPVLSLSEGEGRNAVFLASRGLQVLGVDRAEVGLDKAQSLAKSRGVKIVTEVADLAEFEPRPDYFCAVVSIFAHLPATVRARLYPRIIAALRPGGIVLLEAYSEHQLGRDTGGPKDPDMLMSVQKLQNEFAGLTAVFCREIEREVCEGTGHTGMGAVVQYIGRKALA